MIERSEVRSLGRTLPTPPQFVNARPLGGFAHPPSPPPTGRSQTVVPPKRHRQQLAAACL